MSAIAQLIIEQGRQAAEARAARGQIWGKAIENIGQIPNQVMAQQRANQELQMQRAEIGQRLQLGAQQGEMNALEIGSKFRQVAGANAVSAAVKQHTQIDPITGHLKTDHEAVQGLLMQGGFADEATKYADEAMKRETDLNTAQHSQLQAVADQNSYLKNQLEPVVSETDPIKQAAAYAVLRGNHTAINAQHPVLGNLPEHLDVPNLTAHFNAAETKDAQLKDALTKSDIVLKTSEAKKAEAEAAKAQSEAGAPDVPTLLKTVDAIIPSTDAANAALRAATMTRVKNARTKPEALKAIEDAQTQIGQIHVANIKNPMADALHETALETAKLNLTEKERRDRNVQAVAEGMADGTIPPDPEGLTRQGLYADVIGELHKQGVNFSILRQNYLAQKRLIQTENSQQGVRLDIAVRSGLAMYDAVDTLSEQWKGLGLGILSRANLKLATEGAKGPDAQKLAVQLNGQIAQLTSDVATVEQNGMTPTQESRKVAEESMKSWWGDGAIHAMTAQGRANLRIRDTARKETAPLVPGGSAAVQPAIPATAPSPPAGRVRVKGPKGQTGTIPAGTSLPAGWTAMP